MNNLSEHAKQLMLYGARNCGTFVEGYFLMEDEFYVDEGKDMFEFAKFIDTKTGGAGPRNIDMMYQAFKNPNDKKLQEQVQELADKISRIR
jgi:hypothetical protein